MKPNFSQTKVVDALVSTISHWKYTNDINSPSHWTLIDEEMLDIEEYTTQEQNEQFNRMLQDMLNLLRKVK